MKISKQLLKQFCGKSLSLPFSEPHANKPMQMNRSIITVVGKDTVGIIAKVCTYLAEQNINILDITQTIVSGYFNMMMIVDTGSVTEDFHRLASGLEALGDSIGVQIKCQREEIFEKMHRI